jgi:hypothetical protein
MATMFRNIYLLDQLGCDTNSTCRRKTLLLQVKADQLSMIKAGRREAVEKGNESSLSLVIRIQHLQSKKKLHSIEFFFKSNKS